MPAAKTSTEDQARAKRLGRIIWDWREDRGLKRPEMISRMAAYPGGNISADYLGKLEYGTRSLAGASVEVREAIRLALRIPAATWVEKTGLYVPDDAPEPTTPLPRQGGSISERARKEMSFPIIDDLPTSLEDAIRKYGEDYPQLQDPQIQQQLALARFYTGKGPQTAKDWLAYYLSIASWIGT